MLLDRWGLARLLPEGNNERNGKENDTFLPCFRLLVRHGAARGGHMAPLLCKYDMNLMDLKWYDEDMFDWYNERGRPWTAPADASARGALAAELVGADEHHDDVSEALTKYLASQALRWFHQALYDAHDGDAMRRVISELVRQHDADVDFRLQHRNAGPTALHILSDMWNKNMDRLNAELYYVWHDDDRVEPPQRILSYMRPCRLMDPLIADYGANPWAAFNGKTAIGMVDAARDDEPRPAHPDLTGVACVCYGTDDTCELFNFDWHDKGWRHLRRLAHYRDDTDDDDDHSRSPDSADSLVEFDTSLRDPDRPTWELGEDLPGRPSDWDGAYYPKDGHGFKVHKLKPLALRFISRSKYPRAREERLRTSPHIHWPRMDHDDNEDNNHSKTAGRGKVRTWTEMRHRTACQCWPRPGVGDKPGKRSSRRIRRSATGGTFSPGPLPDFQAGKKPAFAYYESPCHRFWDGFDETTRRRITCFYTIDHVGEEVGEVPDDEEGHWKLNPPLRHFHAERQNDSTVCLSRWRCDLCKLTPWPVEDPRAVI
ncbi:hypothetical protein B0H63DRAFT_485738 [Podospora didyma]|uniref:Uncharacterized protein n=1 Tax=Podospora didyma TaxID=330526 RepID=A0AAE0K4H3_9PEZI|nr:hypothetical protein B0H63DRAFT_485738 [Podospora didyma]